MSDPATSGPLSLAHLPPALLNRCMEYVQLPKDQQSHLWRHNDSPAVYRQGATYLWSSLQQQQLAANFADGWWKDETHPFMECSGVVKLFPSHARRLSLTGVTNVTTGQAATPSAVTTVESSTILEQLKRRDLLGSRPFVMSDILPYRTLKSTACFLWLTDGPNLFSPFNLLAETPSTTVNSNKTTTTAFDHTLAQFNLASRGTHTDSHTDWYGTDAVVHLLEGEKLWIMAPPEHYDAFFQLFPETAHFPLSDVNLFDRLYCLSGSCAVHQRAGDIISVPAGWVHAVVNLSDTVSFGYSYLRPWKLHTCLEWAMEQGKEETLSMVNLDAVFEHTLFKALPANEWDRFTEMQRPFWCLSASQIEAARASWQHLQKLWRTQKKVAKAKAAEQQQVTEVAASLQRLKQPPAQQPEAAAAAAAAATMKD